MNETFLLSLMFLVTAPMGLMPAIVAWLTRQSARKLIAVLNLALWAVACVTTLSFTARGQGMSLPVIVFAVAWVALFAMAVRTQRAAPSAEAPAEA